MPPLFKEKRERAPKPVKPPSRFNMFKSENKIHPVTEAYDAIVVPLSFGLKRGLTKVPGLDKDPTIEKVEGKDDYKMCQFAQSRWEFYNASWSKQSRILKIEDKNKVDEKKRVLKQRAKALKPPKSDSLLKQMFAKKVTDAGSDTSTLMSGGQAEASSSLAKDADNDAPAIPSSLAKLHVAPSGQAPGRSPVARLSMNGSFKDTVLRRSPQPVGNYVDECFKSMLEEDKAEPGETGGATAQSEVAQFSKGRYSGEMQSGEQKLAELKPVAAKCNIDKCDAKYRVCPHVARSTKVTGENADNMRLSSGRITDFSSDATMTEFDPSQFAERFQGELIKYVVAKIQALDKIIYHQSDHYGLDTFDKGYTKDERKKKAILVRTMESILRAKDVWTAKRENQLIFLAPYYPVYYFDQRACIRIIKTLTKEVKRHEEFVLAERAFDRDQAEPRKIDALVQRMRDLDIQHPVGGTGLTICIRNAMTKLDHWVVLSRKNWKFAPFMAEPGHNVEAVMAALGVLVQVAPHICRGLGFKDLGGRGKPVIRRCRS